MTDPKDDDADGEGPVEQGTSVVEWVAAAVGAVLFVAMIGYLVQLGFQDIEGVPQIELSAQPAIRQGSSHLVGFKATNVGKATALNLVVAATLYDGEEEIEHKEATIDYLPMQSSRSGGFIFAHDPADYRLRIAASSYLDP